MAIVIPKPVRAGNVAAFAFTTDPGVNVKRGCWLKSKIQSLSFERMLCRSRFVLASFNLLFRSGLIVLSIA